MRTKILRIAATAVFSFLWVGSALAQQASAPATTPLSWEQQEAFLKKAKLRLVKGVSKGVTATSRVTLTDGVITHDASVQTIDDYKQVFVPQGGKTELNFRDSYRYNVAAWKLARLIGLGGMVPPSVERGFEAKAGAFTWWIDNVLMDEGERQKQNASSPNALVWQQDVALMKMLDQLIANTDRNVGNMQIDKGWRLWLIDHTRAFRQNKELQNPAALTLIDRDVLAKLKQLEEKSLSKELKSYATGAEIKALLARRDAIVKIFDAKGESALFTMAPRN
ncbi:MAG: hypothetical protein ABI811_03930 [Acidobacteriota bacterium]